MKKCVLFLTLLVSVLSFSACSDDDAVIDMNQLEGTWGLVCDEGYEIYEGERDPWRETYDPFNPSEDCVKEVIVKTEENVYSVTHYMYYNGQWRVDSTERFRLEGTMMIPLDGSEIEGSSELTTVSSDELVIEIKGTLDGNEYYNKMSYKRM